MRRAAVVTVLLAAAAGCGSTHSEASKPAKAKHVFVDPNLGKRISVPPAAHHGFWVKLFLSPDHEWWLGQWSGECEAQSTFLIPTNGGKPVSVFNPGDESQALGWTGLKARVLAPRGVCGRTHSPLGIYLVEPKTRHATLLRRVEPQPLGP